MSKLNIKIDRDEFIGALAQWVRWRGHAIPHNMLSERFPLPAGEVGFGALKKAAHSVGINLVFKKRNKTFPSPKTSRK